MAWSTDLQKLWSSQLWMHLLHSSYFECFEQHLGCQSAALSIWAYGWFVAVCIHKWTPKTSSPRKLTLISRETVSSVVKKLKIPYIHVVSYDRLINGQCIARKSVAAGVLKNVVGIAPPKNHRRYQESLVFDLGVASGRWSNALVASTAWCVCTLG